MLKRVKKQMDTVTQQAGAEHAAASSGVSNQAVLSMLMGQGTRPSARSASGGKPLADAMRVKFEQQFGLPMDDVRIHWNSQEPNKFNALAYTYGSNIFIQPGHEPLLPHEMAHVAQQKLGQVQPTGTEHGVPVNESPELEQLADTNIGMSSRGRQSTNSNFPVIQKCNGRKKSRRQQFMGSTPSKYSSVGSAVIKRMMDDGEESGNGNFLYESARTGEVWFANATATCYDPDIDPSNIPKNLEPTTMKDTYIDTSIPGDAYNLTVPSQARHLDMAHKQAASPYWNSTGYKYGPISPEVRAFMTSPDNYFLQLASENRSEGAHLPRYRDPI